MKKTKTAFFCQNCGHRSAKWLGRCPSCDEWNTFAEEDVRDDDHRDVPAAYHMHDSPRPIADISADETERMKTGIPELDRVLGGGIVPGSTILLGGEPGIGKSTLLLQAMEKIACSGVRVLYVSGEESAKQIKLRGGRIGAASPNLLVFVEISLDAIMGTVTTHHPAVIVIDSIQTVYSSALTSAPGSVGQVRESSEKLILLAKKTGIPLFIVGHVTKDGSIAGPKVLEHMVDTVLYFEGDSRHTFRIVRGVKNRFGPTNEIGVFEMRDRGLAEVSNPSELFLSERPTHAAGSVVVPSIEGTRTILVEIQALVSDSNYGIPQRTTIGVDHNRVALLAAVLEKICGVHLGSHDIFINVAGGVKITEPAVDLGIVAALISSFYDRPIDAGVVVCGEIGLTGEVRAISYIDDRIREAARMGFTQAVVPRTASVTAVSDASLDVCHVRNVSEMMEILFNG